MFGVCHDVLETNTETTHHSLTATRSLSVAGDMTTRLSTTITAGALMHGDHWLEERSLMRKVRAVSSGESKFHGLGTGAVRRLLMRYICREEREREQTKILAVCGKSYGTTAGRG